MRINRASDDAAGLAIASSLNSDSRIFTQGVRNLNDGLSVLNIADGAVGELTNIVTRLKELTEQAANGTFNTSQRKALDSEAQALSDEYLRIAQTTAFNGQKLFDGSMQGLTLQAGYGADGTLQLSLGGELGNGTVGTKANFASGANPRVVTLGDVNSDGILDIVTANDTGSSLSVMLGNGDGSFKAKTDFAGGTNTTAVALGDVNSDGYLDIVSTQAGLNTSVLLGNGDGTFGAKSDFKIASGSYSLTLGDVNADGNLDIIAANYSSSSVSVLLGNGNGSFKAKTDFTIGSLSSYVTLGDLNGDGILDIVDIDGTNKTSVLLGNGNGTFKAKTDFATGTNPHSADLGDVNGDGILDIVTANTNTNNVSVLIGNGNGTFKAKVDYAVGAGPINATLGDLNGDGILDIVAANGSTNSISILQGNGDGSFKAKTDYTVGTAPFYNALGDVNSDGVLDVVVANYTTSNTSVLLGQTRDGVAPLLDFSLQTRADALQAMPIFQNVLNNLAIQRGIIGANMSRIEVATNMLTASGENFVSAESRIRDADVAMESANLVRLQILQRATAAVLAQANQQPSLALQLLGA